MKRSETRILGMLVRVRQYMLSRIAAFPANSRGRELYDTVDTCIKNLERHATTQAMHAHGAKEKTAQKHVADEALRNLMEAVNRTARSMSRSMPGMAEKFGLPSSRDIQTWLATARAFAVEAEPLADEFVRRGLPVDFIDDLKARTFTVEQSLNGRAQQSSERVASTASVAEAAGQGLDAVRELDAIVCNIFASNEAELSAWESASRVERAPRYAEKEEEAIEPVPAQGLTGDRERDAEAGTTCEGLKAVGSRQQAVDGKAVEIETPPQRERGERFPSLRPVRSGSCR